MEKLKIKSIKKTENNHHVYDLSVENNSNFFIGRDGNVLTHNCDFLTLHAQASLRNIIETFSRTTRFILTCNYVERIIDPLQSRCQTFKIIPPTKKEVAEHIANICDIESISYEPNAIGKIVNRFYPDIRKMLNTIQSSSTGGELKIDDSLLISTGYMSAIVGELKLKTPQIKKIRQILANSNIDDFEDLFRYLFENAEEYLPGKMGTAAILINDHQYKANFRLDKEINIISCIHSLIESKN